MLTIWIKDLICYVRIKSMNIKTIIGFSLVNEIAEVRDFVLATFLERRPSLLISAGVEAEWGNLYWSLQTDRINVCVLL